MTPQEKANKLVQQYLISTPIPFDIEDAKICSLIAVDEILEECLQLKVEFWEDVKKEIEKL